MNSSSLAAHIASWRPQPFTEHDELAPGPAAALAAVLDRPAPVGPLPPLWHWLYFLTWPPRHALGDDGHPAAGRFLPPLPDRRRMFAGGRLTQLSPLDVRQPCAKTSSLADVRVKQGRSGELVFVTVRSELTQGGELRVVEEQDLVYRSGPASPTAAAATARQDGTAAPPLPWRQELTADPMLLFRFSALTANTHRIHYDEPYTTSVEGYPGLVVHGPLLVLLMLELTRAETDRTVRSLTYRLNRPVFSGEHLVVSGGPEPEGEAALRAGTTRAAEAATAKVVFA